MSAGHRNKTAPGVDHPEPACVMRGASRVVVKVVLVEAMVVVKMVVVCGTGDTGVGLGDRLRLLPSAVDTTGTTGDMRDCWGGGFGFGAVIGQLHEAQDGQPALGRRGQESAESTVMHSFFIQSFRGRGPETKMTKTTAERTRGRAERKERHAARGTTPAASS